MTNLINYPYLEYDPNNVVAGIVSFLIGMSLVMWIIQSIQSHFQPRRLTIFILVSHVTLFLQFILRAVLSNATLNSRFIYTIMTTFLTLGQRMIILANYEFLIQMHGNISCVSRSIRIGVFLSIISSVIIMIIAGIMSYNSDGIDLSFRLRMIAAIISLALTILFFPIWLALKILKDMKKKSIVLLIISALSCLMAAIFVLMASIPDYYIITNRNELWFYIFQIMPIVLAQITWTIFHPKRSLTVAVE